MKQVTLKLLPFDQPLPQQVVQSNDQDQWLNNDNASLVDNLYQHAPDAATITQVHQCQQLIIRPTEQSYQLETEHGAIELQNGDVIALKDLQLLVTLEIEQVEQQQQTELPERNIMPMTDDIWESQETSLPQHHFADPFAQQQLPTPMPAAMPAVTMPVTAIPEISQQTQFGLVEQHDPLNFLYPHQNTMQPQPNLAAGANVLHDLGINEQQTVLVHRQLDAGKPSYAEQSPADMLDEYLVTDDLHSTTPTPAMQTSKLENYYAPTIHDEQKQSMLGSMKRFFSRRKTKVGSA